MKDRKEGYVDSDSKTLLLRRPGLSEGARNQIRQNNRLTQIIRQVNTVVATLGSGKPGTVTHFYNAVIGVTE
jgi:hypothetical protein